MALLGTPFGGPGAYAPPPAPPPALPSTAGSTPVQPADPGAGGSGTGSASGGLARPPAALPGAPEPAASGAAPLPGGPSAAAGTPIHAPATRSEFGIASAPDAPEAAARTPAPTAQRTWRMCDIIAALSGGPQAERLIEAAARPGPVQPGSLMEAIKAVSPAPMQLRSTRLV